MEKFKEYLLKEMKNCRKEKEDIEEKIKMCKDFENRMRYLEQLRELIGKIDTLVKCVKFILNNEK